MHENVLITVIMPVFNSETYIKESISSILNQTHINLKLLIIDDNSTDDTIKIIRSFDDNRIKLYINKNYGLVESLKFGINKVESEFMARMDSDDLSHPRRLEKQLKHLLESRSDICGCAFKTINSKSIVLRKYNVPISHEDIYLRLANNVPFCHGSLLAKTAIFKHFTYGNSYKNKTNEDFNLWVKMIRNGIKFSNLKDEMYYLRIHNASRSYSENKNKFIKISKIAHDRFFVEEKKDIKDLLIHKTILDFLSMGIDYKLKDNIDILKKLSKYRFFKNSFKAFLNISILRFKYFFFLLSVLIMIIYFKIIQKKVLENF